MYVGPDGVAHNHHFVAPTDSVDFKLTQGRYTVSVYAKRVVDQEAQLLSRIGLVISEAQAEQLTKQNTGIFFNWGPDQQAYHPNVETKPLAIPATLLTLGLPGKA